MVGEEFRVADQGQPGAPDVSGEKAFGVGDVLLLDRRDDEPVLVVDQLPTGRCREAGVGAGDSAEWCSRTA